MTMGKTFFTQWELWQKLVFVSTRPLHFKNRCANASRYSVAASLSQYA